MRLIDADALHDALRKEPKWVVRRDNRHNEGYTYDQVHFAIDDAPTVEAVPVNWIEDYLEKIHEDLDYARQDNDEEAMKRIFWKYETIRGMVADWRHDEKTR